MTEDDWTGATVSPEEWHETRATVENTMAWLAIIPGLVIVGLIWMIVEAVTR